eukprot:scaffold599514_cov33-Prasinocladus_malaysianus.AAC.1
MSQPNGMPHNCVIHCMFSSLNLCSWHDCNAVIFAQRWVTVAGSSDLSRAFRHEQIGRIWSLQPQRLPVFILTAAGRKAAVDQRSGSERAASR